jgi:hypothetical protein
MNTEPFFTKVRTQPIVAGGEAGLVIAAAPRQFAREESLIQASDVPTRCAFVVERLLCQHYVGRDGGLIIKYFFHENRIAASISTTWTWSLNRLFIGRISRYRSRSRGPDRAPPARWGICQVGR